MSIQIHGKEYITVAERLIEANGNIKSIYTEILFTNPAIVVKATVTLRDERTFTGISGANPSKVIEKTSPYEVAETSAVGRALGFAGYGAIESIATAEEVIKAEASEDKTTTQVTNEDIEEEAKRWGPCKKCGAPMKVSSRGNVVCSEACWTK